MPYRKNILPYLSKQISGGLRKIARYIFEGILVSLIVQMWMLPLLVVYFHRVSVVSVLLNLWVGFFIALESFGAVIGASMIARLDPAWLRRVLPGLLMVIAAYTWLKPDLGREPRGAGKHVLLHVTRD